MEAQIEKYYPGMFTWNNNNNKTERASKWAQRHTASKMSGKGKRKRIHWKLKFRFSWASWIGCINSVWSVERLPQRYLWNREKEKNWWQRWSIVPRSCERIPIGKNLFVETRARSWIFNNSSSGFRRIEWMCGSQIAIWVDFSFRFWPHLAFRVRSSTVECVWTLNRSVLRDDRNHISTRSQFKFNLQLCPLKFSTLETDTKTYSSECIAYKSLFITVWWNHHSFAHFN